MIMTNSGTYIASRASLPERSAAWRRYRDLGWKITCTWIDEAVAGESADLGSLWVRIEAEIAGSERLILYVEPEDFPLKGALIEVGMAIAHGISIRVVAPGVVLDPLSFRPIGSWVRHPLVTFCDTMDEALEGKTCAGFTRGLIVRPCELPRGHTGSHGLLGDPGVPL